MIVIKTSRGDIHVKLHAEEAPRTVENFLHYVRGKFYENTIFHRVIAGFMIQGGGLTEDMHQKPAHNTVINEAKTAKSNKRGTVAMARTMEPHSASAQFFINLVNNAFLDFSDESLNGFGYCVFGEVVQGMDVVDAIGAVTTSSKQGHGDVPVETIKILEVLEE